MAKYGFLSVLEEEMDRQYPWDYAIDWHKKDHTVEVTLLLDISEELVLEDSVLLYQPSRGNVDKSAYLATIPYEAKKGVSREFLAYLASHIACVVKAGLESLLVFLEDETQETFSLDWNEALFLEGVDKLQETTFYPYPRY